MTFMWGTQAQRVAKTTAVPDALFLDLDDATFYRNTGTYQNPIWSGQVLDGGTFIGLVMALS